MGNLLPDRLRSAQREGNEPLPDRLRSAQREGNKPLPDRLRSAQREGTKKRRIGLLGGSFNPAHAGHVHISVEALKRLKLHEVWWLVSPQNPLKPTDDMASYGMRFASAQAIATHPRIAVKDIELKLGTRYTVDTLRALRARHPRTEFVWLMGADNLAQLHRWKAWQKLLALAPMAIMDRAPYALSALHKKFAWRFRHKRRFHGAALFGNKPPFAWVYLCIPRHPMSATALRKSLGKKAFL